MLTAAKPIHKPSKEEVKSSELNPAAVQKAKPMQAAMVPVDVPTPVPTVSPDQSFAKLSVGETVVLQNVVFAQSEYTLLPASYAELDRLLRALRANPTFQIQIAGHTDDVGDKQRNQTLSEYRAKVVANYLIMHGIKDSRITAKGYGGSRPVANNINEAQRAQNRRVEFTLTE